jgi:Phosphoserine phosphatase RsbU, N-terminal domain
VSTVEDLTRDYRAAFLRYLPRREEAALHAGYELGRAAVVSGTSVLTLAEVHHRVLLEVLTDTRAEDLAQVATAASEFLVEVLATVDMTQRRLHPPGASADQATARRPGTRGEGDRDGGAGSAQDEAPLSTTGP